MSRVTYGGVMKAAGLTDTVSVRRLQPALREAGGIEWRPARQRPERTAEEIAARQGQLLAGVP